MLWYMNTFHEEYFLLLNNVSYQQKILYSTGKNEKYQATHHIMKKKMKFYSEKTHRNPQKIWTIV